MLSGFYLQKRNQEFNDTDIFGQLMLVRRVNADTLYRGFYSFNLQLCNTHARQYSRTEDRQRSLCSSWCVRTAERAPSSLVRSNEAMMGFVFAFGGQPELSGLRHKLRDH